MGGRESMMAKAQEISRSVTEAVGSERVYPFDDYEEAIKNVTNCESLFGFLSKSKEEHSDAALFGYRETPGEGEYLWETYAMIWERVVRLGNALREQLGVGKGDRVGVYGKNCLTWVTMQYAINAAGAVLVPIYDTLGADIVEYVCNHAQVAVVIVADENWTKWELASAKCPSVRHVLRFGVGSFEAVKGEGTVHALAECGGLEMNALPSVGLDDLLVIMYTSGTTGAPKGVMLTNGNVLTSIGAAYVFFERWNLEFTEKDSLLSYLPLSHIYEQQAEAMLIGKGGRIGYYSGNIKLLLSDLEALKPTVFCGVPRVFARFQQRIEETVAKGSYIKRTLFAWANARQLRAVQSPATVHRHPVWDALVMNKVKAKLLPNARLCITGSAPMSAQTNDFLRVVLNTPVLQGYGLTETVGGMICTAPKQLSGTCGGPLPGGEVRLADLPEMGYTSANTPPQGEVCLRGGAVFKGYYKNEEATADAFDADGWFHTGDVGQWNADGSLQIIDRAKNLFKLSQGEYVSPEALEQEYAKAALVLQIFVFGNSLESTLVAVVVPDEEAALEWGRGNGGGAQSLEEVVKLEGFKKELLGQLLEMHGKSKFKSYEKIRDVVIEIDDRNDLGQAFHVDNNLSTPTFKLKRPQLRKKYQLALDDLYAAMKAK